MAMFKFVNEPPLGFILKIQIFECFGFTIYFLFKKPYLQNGLK